MGQLYSHILFRPPHVVSYQSDNGYLHYIYPDSHGLPKIHHTPLIWLQTDLNTRIPCAHLRQPDPDFTILYAHQNAEDLGSTIAQAHLLSHSLNVDVFIFEYSGYGLSERPKRSSLHTGPFQLGREVAPSGLERDRKRAYPSERACCSDIEAAYAYLTNQCDVDPYKIIVFGRSLGSGPAIHCASRNKVAGLVLIAPIASAVRVPLKNLNVTLPFIDTFPNIDRIGKIQCPVLVIHGDMDELVPKSHGEKLFEKIRKKGNAVKPLWIPEARHNNVVEDFQTIVFNRYRTFLEELKAMGQDRSSSTSSSTIEESELEAKPRKELSLTSVRRPPRHRRRRLILSLLPLPRVSLDTFTTNGQPADENRRSRDIRIRVSADSLKRMYSYHDPVRRLSSFSTPPRRRYCRIPIFRMFPLLKF